MNSSAAKERPKEKPRERPLISAIIPTHNRAALLQEALASVYAQEGIGERFEMEVIVVDDASSDNTAEVVRRFPGVRYIRLETNGGPQVARNTGIKASRGKYVSFLDDDDLWLPYKLFVLVDVFESHPEAGVAHGQSVTRFGDRTYVAPEASQVVSGWIFRKVLTDLRGFVGMHNTLIRREALEKAGYFDEELSAYQDFDIGLRLAFHYPFQFVPIPVAVYRRSVQGRYMTHVLQGLHEAALRRIVDNALALVPDNGRGSADLKRRVHTQMHLRIAQELESVKEFDRAQASLLAALKNSPWITTQPWARSSIVQKMRRVALASDSPLDAVRPFCEALVDIAGRCRLRERLGLQMLSAQIWAHAVYDGMKKGRNRTPAWSVLKSVLHHPQRVGLVFLELLSRKLRPASHGHRSR